MPYSNPLRGVVLVLSARHLEIERLIHGGARPCEVARTLGMSQNAVSRARAVIAGHREAEELGMVKR